MNYCTNCGKEIEDGVAFCTECGMPISATSTKQETTVEQTMQVHPSNQVQLNESKPKTEKNNIVSTGGFFGLMFLFSIPIIGWIVCIILACAAKNPNIKHFAKALIIWFIIAVVLSVVLYFVFLGFGGVLSDYISQLSNGYERY